MWLNAPVYKTVYGVIGEIRENYLILKVSLINASRDSVVSMEKVKIYPKPEEVASTATQIAIDLNPDDAEAWAGIADALQCKGNVGFLGADTTAIYAKAKEALNRALSINHYEPTALFIKGIIAEERDWDYQSAEKFYYKALEYDPENPMILVGCSSLLIRQNKLKDAQLMAERAYELDPVNMYTISAKYWSYVASGLYRKASDMEDESAMFFHHRSWNEFGRGLIQVFIGKSDIAIPILEAIKPVLISENKQTLLFILAYAYADTENSDELQHIGNEVYSGLGVILLVDDEEIIRISGQDTLEDMGYKVLLAEDGHEAVEVFKKYHSEIDLIILDMLMPKMNGNETFFKIKEIDKECKIVISSGFTDNKILDSLKKSGLDGFIPKPYKDYELSQLLTEILRPKE